MRKTNRSGAARRAILSLAAVLAGGSTFTSCDTKVKEAFTSALETTFLSLFDPANLIGTNSNDNTGGLLNQTP